MELGTEYGREYGHVSNDIYLFTLGGGGDVGGSLPKNARCPTKH